MLQNEVAHLAVQPTAFQLNSNVIGRAIHAGPSRQHLAFGVLNVGNVVRKGSIGLEVTSAGDHLRWITDGNAMSDGNSVAADGLIQNLFVIGAGILFLK